jgi:hypothetical protein
MGMLMDERHLFRLRSVEMFYKVRLMKNSLGIDFCRQSMHNKKYTIEYYRVG